VRKLILAATGFVCLVGVSYFIGTASGQNGGKVADDAPHKIGLIDIEYIFDNYDKFKILKEEQVAELQDLDAEFKKKAQVIQAAQQEMRTFNEGTPEYTLREQKLTKQIADFEALRNQTKRDVQRKQAKVLQTIYQEVQDTVKKVCNRDGYTVVLKFNRDGVTSTDPQKAMQSFARPVVYYREPDDISQIVLNYLNSQYGRSGNAAEKSPPQKKTSAVKPAGGTGKSGPRQKGE
jgi:outer membrane protein